MGGAQRCRKFYSELVEDLYAFAEQKFRSGRKLSDGASAGEHAASAARQFAALGRKVKVAAIDDAPECPEALVYLWDHFREVSMGLSANGFGPALVTWEALRAWSEFMAVTLEPWEAKVLVTLGYKRAVIDGEEQEKKARRGGKNKG